MASRIVGGLPVFSMARCRGNRHIQRKALGFLMLHILDNLRSLNFYSVMGAEQVERSNKKSYPLGPDGKPLKPCCACPETKKIRDACIIEKGEENCLELIEAHKACMRSLGFNI